jgi:membrane fusion protein, macrolide-specific efflux system
MNDSTNSTGHRRKSPRSRALVIGAVVVVAAGAWYGVQKYRASKSAEGEYLFATVSTGDIEDLVTSTGTLEPRDYVDVGAQVSGQIEKLYVEIGDVVKQGDVLASIDATTSEARVEANRASLKSSRTGLDTQINNRDKAKRDYERQQNLFKEDATTEEALVNAKTTYENAERQIAQSQAQIDQQVANMRIEEKNLQYTRIVAPISGTVMSIAVKQGQTVNASQNVPNVMRIANLGTMTVRAEVSEADVSKLYEGIPVYFTTLGGGNRRWTGTLKRKEPTPKVQNSVVLYNALFDVENEGNALMPSMTAQVFFVVAEARNVLTVPMAALQQGQQISRQLAAKEREEKAAAAAKQGGETPAAPGAEPAAAGATAAAGTAREGGSVPATAQANAGGGAPGNVGAGQGYRPGNGAAGQGQGNRQGNGQRPGGFGGFNGGQMSPEQIEQFRRMRAQNGGPGGFGGGNFGGMNAGGGAPGAGPARAQRRPGTVMIKLADGKLEARRIVVGVTDRVHGQVLEGLKEGEEVVVGKRETNPAPAATPNNNQNNNQNFRPNNFQGGGGNFRPF